MRTDRSWHLPAPCGICGGWTRPAGLCADCVRRFAAPALRCRRCALHVPEGVALCGRCLHEPPAFERTFTAFDYAFPWDEAISAFKFRQGLEWAGPLSRQLVASLPPEADEAELVTAVPLAAARLRERGYNQAWEIARRVAQARGRPARHDLLQRLRDTPHQIHLDRRQRDANLRGAFMPGGPSARAAVRGRCIALVDDVLTTGTTAGEAARALLEAGARCVHLWVLARTEKAAD